MLKHLTITCVLLALLSTCGDDNTGTAPTDDEDSTIAQRDVRPQGQNDVGEDVEAELDAELDATPDVDDVEPALDLLAEPDIVDAANEPVEDTVDDYVPSDVPFDVPEATGDCAELGISEEWVGTFDGDITSNIPSTSSMRFDGPVSGDVSFEIRCVDSKLMVFGALEGLPAECLVPCPFTARMEGTYDRDTQSISGELLDGVIQFATVQLYAEGVFQGALSEGTIFNGDWSGDVVGVNTAILSWIEANGTGTWQAEPVGF